MDSGCKSGLVTVGSKKVIAVSELSFDANTVIACMFDRANYQINYRSGSSVFQMIDTNSNVSISTNFSKFGNSSLYFGGNSQLQILPNSLTQFGTGNPWTLEAWIYLTSYPSSGTQAMIAGRFDSGGGLRIGIADYGALLSSDSLTFDLLSSMTIPLNEWTHTVASFDGTILNVFVNGVLGNSANKASVNWNVGSSGFLLGRSSNGGSTYPFTGYIDSVRVSNSCRYTADFLVPTSRFGS